MWYICKDIIFAMKETLKNLREKLYPLYGQRESEAIIREIFHHLKGWNLTDLTIHADDKLSDFIKNEIDSILQRLLKHEPIQLITGVARFHGLDFEVSPEVLIPRRETEELVDLIIDEANDAGDLSVLDIGTGSGCIAIALAKSLRFPYVTAIDISPAALEIAKKNAANLKVKSINFIESDILTEEPKGVFDIIVSNPPYITPEEKKGMEPNVLLYEPETALFVPEEDPLIFYNRIIKLASSHLKDGGKLYLEINPMFAPQIKKTTEDAGFKNVEILLDSFGRERFIKASYKEMH